MIAAVYKERVFFLYADTGQIAEQELQSFKEMK